MSEVESAGLPGAESVGVGTVGGYAEGGSGVGERGSGVGEGSADKRGAGTSQGSVDSGGLGLRGGDVVLGSGYVTPVSVLVEVAVGLSDLHNETDTMKSAQ